MPDPTPADPVAAYLAQVKERYALVTSQGWSDIEGRHNARTQLAYVDSDRLLAAVEAVLRRHQPKTVTVRQLCTIHRETRLTSPAELDACPDCTTRQQVTCAACDPLCPDDNTWPCEDYRGISRALLGEEESRG